MVWHEDEPIAHPSSVPLHFVSVLARQHVKVVLTGEGSDELLAGYGKYPRALFNWRAGGVYERLVPAWGRRAIASAVLPRLGGSAGPLRITLVSRDAARRQRHVPRQLRRHAAGRAARPARSVDPCVSDPTPPRCGTSTPTARRPMLERLLYTDIKTYLVELLMKQDQMSMSASIESRVPFLDHRAGRIRGAPAGTAEADGPHDQAHPARSRCAASSRTRS